jgi:pSer/pThr/pTyr-binding forkhead associated (FHA) protein
VTLLADGSPGAVHQLVGDTVDVGRTEGSIVIPDPCLAPRHLRFIRHGRQVVIAALDTVNGVYLAVRRGERHTLIDGDIVLVGKEYLRFERLDAGELDRQPVLQYGIRLIGSPLRAAWGRLCQIGQSGRIRDIIHLHGGDVLIGREEGEVRFADDDFLSRRHARISCKEGMVEICDLDSRNGTFVRLRGERELRPWDLIRTGDQLFRYEPA